MDKAEDQTAVAERQARQNAFNAERLHRERMDKLRALAGQELPTHDCPLRKEILNAQSQLAGMGEEVGGFVPV